MRQLKILAIFILIQCFSTFAAVNPSPKPSVILKNPVKIQELLKNLKNTGKKLKKTTVTETKKCALPKKEKSLPKKTAIDTSTVLKKINSLGFAVGELY